MVREKPKTLQKCPSITEKCKIPPGQVQCKRITCSGDPSHLKDKNSELLSNLKCKKLTDFKWYKDMFMTRVMQRFDNNQPSWKKNFLTGLLTLLGKKVINQIKETYKGILPYENLTYGELISFPQKERLKICQDLKLQKQIKKERKLYTKN
ncbi:Uncharacterized protein TCM_028695 [Theobroma cacao]|uniref:Uncharacterized protein n=1 Tax=Theobroma cacao TaxID=3641 RepID=A0A061GC80_THECC|nr:Uncharacterized protein TCM_028695 [Theobroma cacao]